MNLLIGIPCLFNAEATKEAIDSVYGKADLFLIDNGAEDNVSTLLQGYVSHNTDIGCKVHKHLKNTFVNPAWNEIMDDFLSHTNHDYLIIMNSDLVMDPGWDINLKAFLSEHPDMIPIPVINGSPSEGFTEVHSGTPGVFICLSREHVKQVYPIPDYIKIWFGDNWIYEILRAKYKTVVLNNLLAKHYHSQSVSRVEGISEMIEEDKIMWQEKGIDDRNERIKKNA